MPVKVITGSNFGDYAKHVLEYKKPKLPKEKEYSLPAPFNKVDPTLEGKVLAEIKKVFDLYHIWYVRLDSTGKLAKGKGGDLKMVAGSAKGFPDMLAGYNGQVYFIEVKRKGGGKYTQSQLNMWKDIRKHCQKTVIVATNPAALLDYILGRPLTHPQAQIEDCAIVL
jgi:hypothetical protein